MFLAVSLCHGYSVLRAYPVHLQGVRLSDIPVYYGLGIPVSAAAWIVLTAVARLTALELVTAAVLACSAVCRTHLQALFVSAALLAGPLLLAALGLDGALGASVYGLYDLARLSAV